MSIEVKAPRLLRKIISRIVVKAVRLLEYLYMFGLLDQVRIGTPVISIGNLTLGGTGKTPFVRFLISELKKRDLSSAIVSLNYRATIRSTGLVDPLQPNAALIYGDEPTFLAQSLGSVPVVVGPRKWESALWAVENISPQIIVLDDGFQHRPLWRDIDIVLIDASAPMEDYQLFPLGRARELWDALSRADYIVLTKVNQADELWLDQLREMLPAELPVLEMAGRLSGNFLEEGQAKVIAFAGLGRPESFEKSIQEEAFFELLEFIPFPDHHSYTQEEIQAFIRKKNEMGADLILTTDKDWVKIAPLVKDFDFFRKVEFDLSPVGNANEFYEFLDKKAGAWRP